MHLTASAGMHDPAQSGRGTVRRASAERLHLSRQWRPFAQLSDHQAGKRLRVFPVTQAARETSRGHHAYQRAASPGSPRPRPRLHQRVAHRRQDGPYGSQHHLRGPKDGGDHGPAHPLPLDGCRPHGGFARLDCGWRAATGDASLQRDLCVNV